jgi:hypothetical protein
MLREEDVGEVDHSSGLAVSLYSCLVSSDCKVRISYHDMYTCSVLEQKPDWTGDHWKCREGETREAGCSGLENREAGCSGLENKKVFLTR